MADILHDLIINAAPEEVFAAVSTAEGLDKWWTKTSEVHPREGGVYVLNFGPQYIWKAVATKYEPDRLFELQLTAAEADWAGTKVGFILQPKENKTRVGFYHNGWQECNDGYRFSSYCWAMYLRIMKRNIETGEAVPYEKRLSV